MTCTCCPLTSRVAVTPLMGSLVVECACGAVTISNATPGPALCHAPRVCWTWARMLRWLSGRVGGRP